MSRLRLPKVLYRFGYDKNRIEKVIVEVNSKGVTITDKASKFYPYSGLLGVTIGSSLTLHKHKQYTKDVLIEECFTVIGDLETIDLWTDSNILRYDIILTISWFIFYNSKIPACIAFTKGKTYTGTLTLLIVRQKIRKEAEDRFITVNELIMLAMIRHFRSLKDLREQQISRILDKRFSPSHKFYRMIKLLLHKKVVKFDEINAKRDKRMTFDFRRSKRLALLYDSTDSKHINPAKRFSIKNYLHLKSHKK